MGKGLMQTLEAGSGLFSREFQGPRCLRYSLARGLHSGSHDSSLNGAEAVAEPRVGLSKVWGPWSMCCWMMKEREAEATVSLCF